MYMRGTLALHYTNLSRILCHLLNDRFLPWHTATAQCAPVR